jgi:hypothetical protein
MRSHLPETLRGVEMLRGLLLFVLILLIFLGLFFLVESQFSSVFSTCLAAEGGQLARSHLRCTGKFIDENTAALTAIGTLVIAAFTGTLWMATSRQARLASDTLIANQRAFVFVPNISPLWELDNATGLYNWRLRPVLRNTGDTPTRNMTMYVECEIRNNPIPDQYSFTPQAQNAATGTIPPKFELAGGQAPRMPGAAITPQDIIDAQNGRKFIYLWGVIEYNDVFPGTRQHTTRYCYMIFPTGDPRTFVPNTQGQPPTPGTMLFNYIHNAAGNSMD